VICHQRFAQLQHSTAKTFLHWRSLMKIARFSRDMGLCASVDARKLGAEVTG
jgi:hypothetical protein